MWYQVYQQLDPETGEYTTYKIEKLVVVQTIIDDQLGDTLGQQEEATEEAEQSPLSSQYTSQAK